MNIYKVKEHLNMQAIKLNGKYHLHVQHSNDANALRQKALGLKLHQEGYKIEQSKKCTQDNA